MTGYVKPLPVSDDISMPYWEACRRHELVIQRCRDCGIFRFPPASMCHNCHSTQTEWVLASGKGKVYSWIVVVHPVPKHVYDLEVPYVVALVELEEGVRVPTNIVHCDPHRVQAGMPLEVIFDDVTSDVSLPKFQPV